MRALTKALIASLSIVLLLPTAAQADTSTWRDRQGDGDILDITSVQVYNSSKKVVARVNWKNNFPGLRPGGTVKLWIDTDTKRTGPEFLYVVDYPGEAGFFPVRSWKPQYDRAWFDVTGDGRCGKAVKNEFSLKKRYAKVTLTAKKGCFGKPAKVRAAAKTEEWGFADADYNFSENDDVIIDWYKGKKQMTGWTRR